MAHPPDGQFTVVISMDQPHISHEKVHQQYGDFQWGYPQIIIHFRDFLGDPPVETPINQDFLGTILFGWWLGHPSEK